jgi:hypothetical protein
MSWNGDGRLSGTTSSSSSAIQVEGWRRPLLTTLATMLSEEEIIGARRQLDQAVAHRRFSLEGPLAINSPVDLYLVGLEGLEPPTRPL